MELVDYLKDHKIDKDNPASDAESVIIDDFIYMIKLRLSSEINSFYSELIRYIFYQTEKTEEQIINCISCIDIYQRRISDILYVWFLNNNPVNDYINLKELEEEIFESYKSYFNTKADKYYRLYNNDNWLDILKEEAYTENAKKYFNIGG